MQAEKRSQHTLAPLLGCAATLASIPAAYRPASLQMLAKHLNGSSKCSLNFARAQSMQCSGLLGKLRSVQGAALVARSSGLSEYDTV